MNDAGKRPPLKWSAQLTVLPQIATPTLKGDKIILPPSALEELLSAATVTVTSDVHPLTSAFDPYNPYSFAAERHAREQLIERQQNLPHPLTFRLVNPVNGRIVYAGIREFSAETGAVGLSPFLREALGTDESIDKGKDADSARHAISNGDLQNSEALPRLTVHVEELPKGTFVKLRPLEAGYDAEDWKALLEQYLRDTFTTLTKGEEIVIPAGKEAFRFLVDGLKPNEEAVSLVDTDLEVDIEPLSEDQARETLQKLAQKSQRGPGTKDGSSAGGKILIASNETGQVRPLEYVDYTIDQWQPTQDVEFELTGLDGVKDIDLFVTPASNKHRSLPREDNYIFGDLSTRATKRIKIKHTSSDLDDANALWIAVRGYAPLDEDVSDQGPTQYNLRISYVGPTSIADQNGSTAEATTVGPDEELCSNCHQAVPKRTMFLHQNFCLRNNSLCPHCKNVFLKVSEAWKNHWHCPHDESYGDTSSSKIKHDHFFHTSRACPSCDYDAFNTPDLAHHRTTTCPGKLILCQFCHLQVAQQGPDDQSPDSAEVILSGLTPHELSDGARTTECHLCSKIVRLRDMSTHLKHHNFQRLSRLKPRVCRNVNCGRTVEIVLRTGDVKYQAPRNDLGLCDICFGPLYVSQYDPDGKALRRRIERRYLTQLLTGCNQSWCQNEYCRTGRNNIGQGGDGKAMTSKDAMALIKPSLDNLKDMVKPLHICTDEASQKRRNLAEMIAAEAGDAGTTGKGKRREREVAQADYELEWCVAALEIEGDDLDKARAWLKGFAPTRAEAAK